MNDYIPGDTFTLEDIMREFGSQPGVPEPESKPEPEPAPSLFQLGDLPSVQKGIPFEECQEGAVEFFGRGVIFERVG